MLQGVQVSAEFVAEGLTESTDVDNIIPHVKVYAQRLFPSFLLELSAKGTCKSYALKSRQLNLLIILRCVLLGYMNLCVCVLYFVE